MHTLFPDPKQWPEVRASPIGYANKPGKAKALADVQAAAITDDLNDITRALQDDAPATGQPQ